MNHDIKNILIRQSEWQKNRKQESWAEKLRKSARARDSMAKLQMQSRNNRHQANDPNKLKP
jgi:hypothetical protein